MAFGHKNIKRIMERCLEELNATKEIAKVTSLMDGLDTLRAKLDIQVMNYNGFLEPTTVRNRLMKKHKVMLDYYEKTFGDFFEIYDYNRPLPVNNSKHNECIWVCWWQGLDNAPDLVKVCIESITKNAGNHRVIVITDDNYKEYVNIPEWIEEKKNSGIISRTHYSDILRLSLLAEYGGMWLDATFFCSDNKLEEYFSHHVWSIKRPDYAHSSVASGYFATYSLQCHIEERWIFATIRDFFLHYWKINDKQIDYLTLDYMIVLAQKKDSRIGEAFKRIIPNNPCCDELYKVLGDPYEEELWQMLKQETSLFKLTWKQEFPKKKDGHDTFYAKLLDGTL